LQTRGGQEDAYNGTNKFYQTTVLRERLNHTEISRITGSDVKTVKKYIRMEDFNQPLSKPRQIRGSKLDKYKEQIDKWMISEVPSLVTC
jgi:hypothetical protein